MGRQKSEPLALLSDYDTASAYQVAYHSLFANISLNWENTGSKHHAIALALPSPTTREVAAAAQLAIAAAQQGTQTVLVDADLRHPTLQQRFGVAQGQGLSDLLLAEDMQHQKLLSLLSQTFMPNLRLLSAGTALPQTSQAMPVSRLRTIVTELYQAFDETKNNKPGLIIFHAPPVLTAIDTTQISSLVDQTFLLIVNGETTRTQAKRAQQQLERTTARLSGVILLDA